MVTPDRRRVAVVRLQVRFGVSQRRACGVVGQHRSTQRRPRLARVDADGVYGQWLCDFAQSHLRWGWRKAHDVAAREGLVTNPKRTLRLWRAHCLQRPPQRRHKRRRLGDGTAARLRAVRPGHVWALDFQFDETAARRRLKLLNVIDEFTREALAIHVDHSIDATKSSKSSRPSPRPGALHSICEWTTVPNSSLTRCETGVNSQAPTPPTSSPARRGRTATSSRSTAGSATSASTSRTSPTSSKPESSSRTGDAITITIGRTDHSTDKPPPPTLLTTKQTRQPNTHNTWTN